MTIKHLIATSFVAALAATAAAANTTSVNCDGYVIAISDNVAAQGEAMAGSLRAFRSQVCERSAGIAANVEKGTVDTIPVFVEELGVRTRVVIFKAD